MLKTFQDYVAAATTTEQRSRKFWGENPGVIL